MENVETSQMKVVLRKQGDYWTGTEAINLNKTFFGSLTIYKNLNSLESVFIIYSLVVTFRSISTLLNLQISYPLLYLLD